MEHPSCDGLSLGYLDNKTRRLSSVHAAVSVSLPTQKSGRKSHRQTSEFCATGRAAGISLLACRHGFKILASDHRACSSAG